ncbi:MAG: LPS export ABC transporter periplasmic protein LptC [Methylococcaceae bacterium]|nr:LPS export ABC transporter periplasmic protein LptC [Methylococcaceae bacterium]
MVDWRNASFYLVLALLSAGSWWLADKLFPPDSAPVQAETDNVDYYSNNIHRIVLDVTGKPKESLFAVTMTHYKNDDRTEMEKPVMTLYKQDKEPWIIHSETGTSLSEGQAVLLHGDVLITRKNDQGEEIKIITRNVKYTPSEDYAETAEHVEMLGAHDVSSGTGAKVHFEPELLIQLLADVRRKHEMQ